MPAEYIYSSWTAPLNVQKAAGVDYPASIVDHQEAREENLARMKAAYAGKPIPAPGALKRSLVDKESVNVTSKPKTKKT